MSAIGEILRAAQKDESYLKKLRDSVSGLMVDIFGHQYWCLKDKWTEPLVRLIYYSATTLSQFQTLGEEYTGIVQTRKNLTLPAWHRRFLSVLFKSFGARLIEDFFESLESSNLPRESQLKLSYIKSIISFIDSIHTCIFYYQGIFYDLPRRLTGIRYAKVGPASEDTRAGFRLLGHLATLNVALNFVVTLVKLYKNRNMEGKSQLTETSRGVVSSESCLLCLELLGTNGGPAATPCGHLGCWTCLLESTALTGSCPLCRASCSMNRIIPLQNL